MKTDALRLAALAACLGATLSWAETPVENRAQTPAEQAVEQGAGTAALGTGASSGTGGPTSNSDKSSPGIAVDEGTVMRPLSAQGRNSTAPQDAAREPPRRKQLYGLNPKADESPSPSSESR